MRWVLLLGLIGLIPQDITYPPEGQPIIPSIQILWMNLPAPQADTVIQDLSLITDKLIVVTDQDYTTQTAANAACNAIIANDNQVLNGDPTNKVLNRLAGCVIVHYIAVNASTDFNWGFSNLSSLRDQYGADLIQFVTRSGDFCGLGYQDAWKYGVTYGYSWVSKLCIISNYSNIHEEGHNRGANHDAPNTSGSFYAWAHGVCDSAHGRRDVMTYPSPCGGSRGPYFSNPRISPYGTPFGDALTMDNARVIQDTALTISNFRQLGHQNHQR